MRVIGLCLEFLSHHATIFLAVGVLSGLVLPDLAALLRPYLGPIVVVSLITALIRLNFSDVVSFKSRPLLISTVLLFTLIICPVVMALILTGTQQFTGLSVGLVTGLVLMAAAPPILNTSRRSS